MTLGVCNYFVVAIAGKIKELWQVQTLRVLEVA